MHEAAQDVIANGSNEAGIDVPEGWVIAPLLDVIDYEGGTQPPKKQFVYQQAPGYVRLLQIRDFGEKPFPTYVRDDRKLKKATENDLLLARYGGDSADDCLGRICTGLSGAYNVALVKLILPKYGLNRDFVRLFFRGPWFRSAISRNSRSCQMGFNRSDLKWLSFLLPPLAEQDRIVLHCAPLLKHVEAARNHVSRVPTTLKRYRQAVLATACSGRLTEEWREQHTAVENASRILDRIQEQRRKAQGNQYKGSQSLTSESEDYPQLPDLPGSWTWCRVEQIANVCLGGTPSRKNPRFWGGKIPWVSSGEVANCRIGATRERITDEGLANSNAKLYPKNTVLIAMIGEGKTRGQSAILDIDACTNQNVAGLVFDTGDIYPDYIWCWALSEYERNRSVGRGGAQPALNGEKVRGLLLPLPPRDEQVEIVKRVRMLLAHADQVEDRASVTDSLCRKMLQTILAKAFRGELAPTEAELARREGRDYEPASVLLERIRAERASLNNAPKLKHKLRRSSAAKQSG